MSQGHADNRTAAEEILRRTYGYRSFRTGQEEAVLGLLQGKDALCVMPTGSGKSICYQIPALLFPGVTLVISPLISLMNDQVSAMRNRGIPAVCLNSSLAGAEYGQAAMQTVCGEYKIICVAPERLQAPGFVEMCLQMDISLIAVDEAHCISQWGQDFRPSYLKIPEFIRALPKRPVVGAFTATATPKVRKDILDNLGLVQPVEVTTGFDRPNLSFSVYEPGDKDQTLLELVRDRYRQSGIVYCSTRKTVEAVCAMLQREGFPATRYHAGLTHEERVKNQEDFLFDRQRVMVATNAFGMGIDKANVAYVIHYNMPKSLEAYYQEAGRAGRDGCDADCILLYSGQDVILARWLIDHSDPNPDLSPEMQDMIRDQDHERLKRMTFYARSKRCLRGDILRYFGENPPLDCGNCSNCVPDCEHVDITTDAQMILSCIARTEMKLPEETIISLLLGEITDQIPKSVQPDKLTTFGLMKDRKAEQIRDEILALCDQGFLERKLSDPGVLLLNERSREVLFRNRRVAVRRNLKKVTRKTENMDLFQALQQLRYRISAREYIASTHLFSDSVLREICITLPRTKKQLAGVEGMGIFKANRYGDEIFEVLEQYRPETKAPKQPDVKKRPEKKDKGGSFQQYKDRTAAEEKTEAYLPWRPQEDRQLIREYEENIPLAEISRIHRRTRGAILSRLRKLRQV